MPKIFISTSTFDLSNFISKNLIIESGYEIVKNPYNRKLTENEICEMLKNDVIAMIAGTEPITRKVLETASSLKIISRCGVGMDNVDLLAASEFGIKVFNTPDCLTQSVAELTIGHILSLIRNIVISDRNIRNNKWKQQMGNLLSEQTVGVIGYGRIGKRVSQLCSNFGANVIVYDPYFIDKTDCNISITPFNTLLSKSDIVTLHLPMSEQNHHILGEKELKQLKDTSYVLNMSRGGLIDETALYSALKDNKIRGAALDCFENEPYNGKLLELENVQVTSHIGSYAIEARNQMEKESSLNLINELNKNINKITL
jgi:D-3-phosphoglycerate dehydrogenase